MGSRSEKLPFSFQPPRIPESHNLRDTNGARSRSANISSSEEPVLRDIPERLRVAPMRLLVQGVAGHKDVEATQRTLPADGLGRARSRRHPRAAAPNRQPLAERPDTQ
jgi:hypothetical protein